MDRFSYNLMVDLIIKTFLRATALTLIIFQKEHN